MSAPSFYTGSSAAPSYTSLPTVGEERIQYTPRSGAAGPQGKFIRSWEHVILTLDNQEETALSPCYAQGAVVNGILELSKPKIVQRVVLKLEGEAALAVGNGTASTSDIVSRKVVLWNKDNSSPSSKSSICPAVLPFCLQFPETFTSGRPKRTFQLPPSFEVAFLEIPFFLARCTYRLRLYLTISRQYRLTSWSTVKSYSLSVEYRPRVRARPRCQVDPDDCLVSRLKENPDEWIQRASTMAVRPNPDVEPIDCYFVLPTSSAFALTDAIPFHIQLCGSPASLLHFLPPRSPLLAPESVDSSSGHHQPSSSISPIQVLITRQVVVEVDGQRSFRNSVIGTGRVWPLPPTAGSPNDTYTSDISASWQGEVRCGNRVAPSFNIGKLLVKDYIVLVLTPPKAKRSPLQSVEIVHPIRLVTDPWSESGDRLHPQDT